MNGIPAIEATLAQLGGRLSFEEFFSDWLAANYLDEEAGALPLHGYAGLQLERPAASTVVEGAPSAVDASVNELGADYVLVRGESDLQITFTGVTRTLLLDLDPRGGDYYWWSNRADESRANSHAVL